MRVIVVTSILLATVATAGAQDLDVRVAQLRERIERIENARGHDAAEDAIAHARRAIRSARQADQAHEPSVRARALRIADAALVLGDRLAARERARHALADARERKRAATRRSRAAREALERSIALRDAPE